MKCIFFRFKETDNVKGSPFHFTIAFYKLFREARSAELKNFFINLFIIFEWETILVADFCDITFITSKILCDRIKTEAFTISVEIIVTTETGYEVVDLLSTKIEERRKWNAAASVAWPTISFVDILSFSLFLDSKRMLFCGPRVLFWREITCWHI